MADKPARRLITGRRSARSRPLSSTFSKRPALISPRSHSWAGAWVGAAEGGGRRGVRNRVAKLGAGEVPTRHALVRPLAQGTVQRPGASERPEVAHKQPGMVQQGSRFRPGQGTVRVSQRMHK